ncbi:hypothetical protein NQ315_007314 [Exocentrus adspersus]|uniref:Uncharacterized protein n=1 Tax=Exocentrus adspersus TaxID=1586481 RepID=A0AAV8WE35_9CUCU|nr:hypothetical protein NQ315_007314 [Exocentrus adspersus]
MQSVPTRQVRVLPGLGKLFKSFSLPLPLNATYLLHMSDVEVGPQVHVTYTYDRVVPYVGHKRLTVVTSPARVYATRPSILQREYDRIENKVRPWVGYSATNRYLNSDSAVKH